MCLRKLQDPKLVLRLGMIFLIIATLAMRFFHGASRFDEGFTDGVKGMLYGPAIGLTLLSVRLRSRGCNSH
jgi:hypothetical protein